MESECASQYIPRCGACGGEWVGLHAIRDGSGPSELLVAHSCDGIGVIRRYVRTGAQLKVILEVDTEAGIVEPDVSSDAWPVVSGSGRMLGPNPTSLEIAVYLEVVHCDRGHRDERTGLGYLWYDRVDTLLYESIGRPGLIDSELATALLHRCRSYIGGLCLQNRSLGRE